MSDFAVVLGGLIVSLLAAFGMGWRNRGQKEKAKDDRAYRETMAQAGEARTSDNDADNDKWLRERGKR